MQMGFRSLFVMLKLGFEMRKYYDDLLEAPLPDQISRELAALSGRGTPGLEVVPRPATPRQPT
jgi:hypothetical protein